MFLTNRSRARCWLVGLAALSLVAAACGDDDDEGAAETTTTAGEVAETTTTAGEVAETTTTEAAPDCTLDAPVVIGNGLGNGRESDDPNAIFDSIDGLTMAVDEINAAGGICGQDVVLETPVISPAVAGDAAKTDVQQLLAVNPNVIFAFGSSSALDAAAADVAAGGVPTINFSTNPQARTGGTAASEWLWSIRVSNDVAATIATEYAIDELGACDFGLIYFNLAFGLAGSEAQKAAIAEAGCNVFADAPHDFNAEDLTTEVLAMDGADAVLAWGTPNNLVLEVTTFENQGISVPVIMPASAGFSSFYGAFSQSQLENITAEVDCNPLETAAEWAAAFEEEFGYTPSYSAAQSYDAIFLVKSIVEDAGAADPATIQAGLNSGEFDGVCGPYKNTDGALATSTTMIKFTDGLPETIKVIELG